VSITIMFNVVRNTLKIFGLFLFRVSILMFNATFNNISVISFGQFLEKSVPITTNDCMVVGFTITYVISAYHH
jgi:hypothetical protein